MAALPVRGQVGIAAESMIRIMEELNAATERMTESNRRLAEAPIRGAGGGAAGTVMTSATGGGGGVFHSHAVPLAHSHALLDDGLVAEASDLRQRVQDLQKRLDDALFETVALRNLVLAPACDPNASRCCGINFASEDTWFCHVVVNHVGIEDARRLLIQYPDPVELMEVTRRARRHLG